MDSFWSIDDVKIIKKYVSNYDRMKTLFDRSKLNKVCVYSRTYDPDLETIAYIIDNLDPNQIKELLQCYKVIEQLPNEIKEDLSSYEVIEFIRRNNCVLNIIDNDTIIITTNHNNSNTSNKHKRLKR